NQSTDAEINTTTEEQLRDWFEKKLLTEAGARRPVVQETNTTEGMPNSIVERLVSLYILHIEDRGAQIPLYEIVHDRFVEPILRSNQAWRLEREKAHANERGRNARRVFIASLSILILLMFVIILVATILVNQTNNDALAAITKVANDNATAHYVDNVYAAWEATRVPGLGVMPTISLTKTPFAYFVETATAQASLANDWTIQPTKFDNIEMVRVPAGCFWMGYLLGDINERPVFEECPGQYWIDRYEVTKSQYEVVEGNATQDSTSPRGDVPKTNISWEDAIKYCMDAHPHRNSRLPTEIEWEYAARGPNSLLFPWGNTSPGSFVVYGPSFLPGAPQAGTLTPQGPVYPRPESVRDDKGGPARPQGASWVGAYDMSGNVREWTMTLYQAANYALLAEADNSATTQSPILGPTLLPPAGERVARGGTYASLNNDAIRPSARDPIPAYRGQPDTGFRCIIVGE
ncbi:MAG: SUMF1/EgtB/PvdO family nonheme iron enzyme, partial [Chloroflexota bacterium]